jgi:hypothetical protein
MAHTAPYDGDSRRKKEKGHMLMMMFGGQGLLTSVVRGGSISYFENGVQTTTGVVWAQVCFYSFFIYVSN